MIHIKREGYEKSIILYSSTLVDLLLLRLMCDVVSYRTGFEAERIEALLHMIELSLKHQTDKFGLHLGIVSEYMYIYTR